MIRYVWRELIRNPRRTLVALVGVTLGIGLFSGVLFFIDGSGATMTKRALAPLALDMQRVLTEPLGRPLTFQERLSTQSLRAGESANVTLTVKNVGAVAAHEVVINDEPPSPLAYVHGTTVVNGVVVPDVAGQSPLAQGPARSGLNIGTIPSAATLTLTFRVRATQPVPDARVLRLGGTMSTREQQIPVPANTPPALTIQQLQAAISKIPGVAAANGLAFVDLPPGSLRSGGAVASGPVRVFGFDPAYQKRYPSIRLANGTFAPGAAALSVEASRSIGAKPGATIALTLPGRTGALTLPVSAVTDLARAKPLFASRKISKLEDFLYVPNSVVVSQATFRDHILPAFRAASAVVGTIPNNLPVLEVDVAVDRGQLRTDPSSAFAQTKKIARSMGAIAPRQDYLIDNISNTLQVARDDAIVGKRMFLFLGLPGVLLAIFLTAYAGTVLADTQRRELANLRVRGAHSGQLLRMLVVRSFALATAGTLAGTTLGFASVIVILGREQVMATSAAALMTSALIAAGAGLATTAAALYLPGRRSMRREINEERREVSAPESLRRWPRDLAVLVFGGIAVLVVMRFGGPDPSPGSVSEGKAVAIPSWHLVAPMIVWVGGVFLTARLARGLMTWHTASGAPNFGSLLRGTLSRSMRRRAPAVATGVVGVGLVIAFGTSLALFAATYDGSKAADSRFAVGSDVRVTPSPLSTKFHPKAFASNLRVDGVDGTSPVVSKLENAVLLGRFDQNRADLAAVDPASLRSVGAFARAPGATPAAMDALEGRADGVLLDVTSAQQFSIRVGDQVQILLARGTKSQKLKTFVVVGEFTHFPGFPQGVNVVVNLSAYQSATGITRIDFFLAHASDGGPGGLKRATAALRAGPASRDALVIESSVGALNKDQSSLTAVNVNGLVDLNWFFTMMMSAAGIATFVFGLMLQRRREYVTLRAQGMRTREVGALVLGEAAVVAVVGLVSGLLVGLGMATLMIRILRPLFTLDPVLVFPVGRVAVLGLMPLAAAIVAGLVATAMIRRLRPTELLREP